jgi:hypothetical protein
MYVFGIDRGSMSETAALWHVSLNEPAAGWQKINAAGGSGLVEFDIDTLTMRSVECVSKGDCPEKRAQCLIAAYSLPSPSGSDCHHVVCGYGYTTFNHASKRCEVPQAMSDMWKCTLVAEAATASHAPLNEPEIVL